MKIEEFFNLCNKKFKIIEELLNLKNNKIKINKNYFNYFEQSYDDCGIDLILIDLDKKLSKDNNEINYENLSKYEVLKIKNNILKYLDNKFLYLKNIPFIDFYKKNFIKSEINQEILDEDNLDKNFISFLKYKIFNEMNYNENIKELYEIINFGNEKIMTGNFYDWPFLFYFNENYQNKINYNFIVGNIFYTFLLDHFELIKDKNVFEYIFNKTFIYFIYQIIFHQKYLINNNIPINFVNTNVYYKDYFYNKDIIKNKNLIKEIKDKNNSIQIRLNFLKLDEEYLNNIFDKNINIIKKILTKIDEDKILKYGDNFQKIIYSF